MYLTHYKIEYFFLVSLLGWFFIGYENFLNFTLILQYFLIFFFLDLKVNKKKFILSLIISIFIFFFSKNIDAIKIYLISIFIIMSFDYKNKINDSFSFKEIILFLLIFLFLLTYKHAPHVQNYKVNYKLKKNIFRVMETEPNLLEKKIVYKKNSKFNRWIYSSCPTACVQAQICDENLCSLTTDYLNNRYTINHVDVNLISIILLVILLLCFQCINNKKNLIFTIYILLGLLILFLTKSRAGLIFYLLSIFIFYFKKISRYKIFLLFVGSQLFIIILGYLMVNSVADPMKMYSPAISENGLIYLPVEKSSQMIDENYLTIKRLYSIFDSSNYIRFSSFFQTYLIYLNDFQNIIFPDHADNISQINYKTYVGKEFIVKASDYDPHNLFMSLTKEVGLIGSIFFYYLIFSFFKYQDFKLFFFPLIFSSIFLGIGVLYIVPTIILFCFKTNNNLKTIFTNKIHAN